MKTAYSYIQTSFDKMDQAVAQLINAGSEIHCMMAEVHQEQALDLDIEGTDALQALQEELDTVINGIKALEATKRCLKAEFHPDIQLGKSLGL